MHSDPDSIWQLQPLCRDLWQPALTGQTHSAPFCIRHCTAEACILAGPATTALHKLFETSHEPTAHGASWCYQQAYTRDVDQHTLYSPYLFQLCVGLCRHHQVTLQCCARLMKLLPEVGCCCLHLQQTWAAVCLCAIAHSANSPGQATHY